MHVEHRFEQTAAVVTVFRMQHSLPLAQIGPQFGFGPELGRWEKADRRRIDGTCLALAAVGTEGDAQAGLGIGAGILRINLAGVTGGVSENGI